MRNIIEFTDNTVIEQWERIPVDDIAYIDSKYLMILSDHEFNWIAKTFEYNRYTGWRNYNDLWRSTLGLDNTHNKIIMDYGCGFGIESLQFAKNNNKMILVDISQNNINVAKRLLTSRGYDADTYLASINYPFINHSVNKFDIFYSNGVLHHTPYAVDILNRVKEFLNPDGEVRLMLYSDIGFKWATGELPTDIKQDVRIHPKFKQFVSAFDGTGYYADWYNEDKVIHRFGDNYDLIQFNYITYKYNIFGMYLTVTLKLKT